MKRLAHVCLSILAVVMAASCFAQNDGVSLADAARQNRKTKQSEGSQKVFDNDSLPKEENISVVGQRAVTSEALNAEVVEPTQNSEVSQDARGKANDNQSKLAIEPGQSAGEREMAYGEWRKKIADQKDTVALLQRESDVLQREYRLRAAAMYADVGNRLRNATQWDKQDRDYKDKLAAKQKDLDRAKQQLSDMQEQARKAGVPVAVTE
ncbi:MAG: hypothetical protein JO249_12435 [Acidobacteria bacterium]|nr:hypothetical protein [Acidobacteriota bacterium]